MRTVWTVVMSLVVGLGFDVPMAKAAHALLANYEKTRAPGRPDAEQFIAYKERQQETLETMAAG